MNWKMGNITEQPGFVAVCLNIRVLQTASYQYRQHYGTAPPTALHVYAKACCVCILCVSYFPLSLQIYSLQTIERGYIASKIVEDSTFGKIITTTAGTMSCHFFVHNR